MKIEDLASLIYSLRDAKQSVLAARVEAQNASFPEAEAFRRTVTSQLPFGSARDMAEALWLYAELATHEISALVAASATAKADIGAFRQLALELGVDPNPQRALEALAARKVAASARTPLTAPTQGPRD